MEDDFRIALRCELVSEPDQSLAEFQVVEDFAVEGNLERAVWSGHGLRAAGQIDDAQPSVSKADGAIDSRTGCIGSAVADLRRHPANGSDFDRPVVMMENSSNATHRYVVLTCGSESVHRRSKPPDSGAASSPLKKAS